MLEAEVAKGEGAVDIMNWASRAALEYIGQGSLGYTFDALNEQRTNGYSEAMKAVQYVVFSTEYSLEANIVKDPYSINLDSSS